MDFLGLLTNVLGFLGGFDYSKMANLGFRTSCNTRWIILATSKNMTKYGPPGPLFITEMLQRIEEKHGHL